MHVNVATLLILVQLSVAVASIPAPSPPPASYAFADTASLRTAVAAYNANAASATATHGPISSWGVSAVTNMNRLFQELHQFNADISSWDTSRVTSMAYMFWVRSVRVPCPQLPQSEAFLPLAPPTTPPHPSACLPACRPSSYASVFYSAARVGVQPAAELRHVQRHRHGEHVWGVLRACPALSLHSPRGLPAFWPPTTPPHPPAC